MVDISLVSSGVEEDITIYPFRFEAALKSVIKRFPWASDLQVVKAQQKTGSSISFRFWLQAKDQKKENTQ
jgi:hypothetical protein